MKLQKAAVSILIVLAIVLAYIILFVARPVYNLPLIDADLVLASLGNRLSVFSAIAIYQLRFLIAVNIFKKETTLFVSLQKTKHPYLLEFLFCTLIFFIAPLIMALYSNHMNKSLDRLDFIALFIFMISILLSFTSELQRFFWKRKPANKGKLYTEGLFTYSMHINYFGEIFIFPSLLYLVFESVMLSSLFLLMQILEFIFFHIPRQDSYLEEKYGESFKSYESRTKKLIPFIY